MSVDQSSPPKSPRPRTLFPGLADKSWFDRINEHAKERDLILKHYIVSSGIHELIKACPIHDAFRQVFASKFIYM